MLDIKFIRDHDSLVREKLAARGEDAAAIDQILDLDRRRRELLQRTENLKARRNEISKLIPQKAKAKEPIDTLKEESKAIGEEISQVDADVRGVDESLRDGMMRIPNLPAEGTPAGKDDSENVKVREWGEPVKHAFEAKPHWELGEALGILDLPRGARVAGSGFAALRGLGARLERALIQWMLDEHTEKNGYTEASVPYLVTRQTMTGTGQLPKFEDDAYRIDSEDLFLIPTAEVPLTNLHAGEIMDGSELPLAYVSHTPCFRREAGSAGRENRGISRVHQFHKVELVHITRPEDSEATHEKLVGHATGILEALNVPYRVMELCTGDLGFAAAKCYDLEIWAPGMETWLEVSSCSNFLDYQARRANIRYRPEGGGKPRFAHTLNGSGLALPRLIISLMENNQREDGSIGIPEVLHDRMGADEIRA